MIPRNNVSSPNTDLQPRQRIDSIDALRGFALIGILMVHCMEHFDINFTPVLSSPFWQWIDTAVRNALLFLFAGKAYAVFSLLFGLSFFIQMDSQARKGKDFRLRFLWRLTLLLLLGYLNGVIYMGEFLLIYALLGIFLVPLYKVPTKWLIALTVLLFVQIPDIVRLIALLTGNAPAAPTGSMVWMDAIYDEAYGIFTEGSFRDVIRFNLWESQPARVLWTINASRYPQLLGLFIAGLLIGRSGIYRSEEKMARYSRKALPYGIALFAVCYTVMLLCPSFGLEGYALDAAVLLFKTYANLGMTLIYVSAFVLLYYTTRSRRVLNRLAPFGRMSVTNYMIQSAAGVCLFYGFGANLALTATNLQAMLVGWAIILIQILYSKWWLGRFHYGPVEWLWRTATWFRRVPNRRRQKAPAGFA